MQKMNLLLDFNTSLIFLKGDSCLDCTEKKIGRCTKKCSNNNENKYICDHSCIPLNILSKFVYLNGSISGYYVQDDVYLKKVSTYNNLN